MNTTTTTTTTTTLWVNDDKPISFYTPARVIAFTVLFTVLIGIVSTIIINYIKEFRKKKLTQRINNLALIEDTEMDYFFQ